MGHVFGNDDGEGYGVYGESRFRVVVSPTEPPPHKYQSYGVQGYSEESDGVHGDSLKGRGVSGWSRDQYGVFGQSDNTGVYGDSFNGRGVLANSFNGIGLHGFSFNGKGVYGESRGSAGVRGVGRQYGLFGTSDDGEGVRGESRTRYGIRGISYSHFGIRGSSFWRDGVYGDSVAGSGVSGSSTYGKGVYGESFGSGDGVRGISDSGNGLYGKSNIGNAAHLDGNVIITGSLQKGGGSFKIDHPLDPANKYLSHSFVESSDMKNVYDGVIALDNKGEAKIELPDWFGALNKDFRYQLTAIGAPGSNLHIAEEISDTTTKHSSYDEYSGDGNHVSRFKIAGGTSGMKVSWQVTGIRKDPWANTHRIQVEEDKPDKERGYYMYPDLYGQPIENGISRLFLPKENKSLLDESKPIS
jgi:hypothetical protein